jgi:hypothetical protein
MVKILNCVSKHWKMAVFNFQCPEKGLFRSAIEFQPLETTGDEP